MQWDPGRLVLTAMGVIVTSFAEGSMVAIARDGDGDTVVTGTSGTTVRLRSKIRSARITVRLLAGGPENKAFNLNIQGGGPPFPVTIVDLDSLTTHVCPDAFFSREPDVDYAAEAPVREWVIVCPVLATAG